MNALKILGENFVSADCSFTFASGSALEEYLYDQKQNTLWLSSGSSDAVEESIIVVFKNWQGAEVSRTFDRILLLNTNFKAITAQYWDGAAWQAISEATLTLAVDNKIIEIVTPLYASRFRIKCTTTQVANQEKSLGELKVCANVLELSSEKTRFQRNDDQKAGAFRLAGGSLVSWKEWTKFKGSLSIENLTLADKNLILPYAQSGGFITLVFYDDFDLTEVYEVSITDAPRFSVDRKMGLFSMDLTVEEK